jgi:small subunit ribosomal protein S13
MARIAGINLQNHKHIWIALTSVYGIGDTRAKYICEKVGIDSTKKVKDLEEKELETIRQFIEEISA